MKLNLQTQSKEQEILLAYLEQNASAALAEKINNGIPANKNGTQLIMKKDLTGFMKYATEEARKAAPKGATSACIEDKTVFGWLMHYFEEDSIEGRYFNLDGTPYTPPKKETKKPAAATVAKTNSMPQPKQEAELTLFDMLAAATEQKKTITESKPEPVVTEPAAVDPKPEAPVESTFIDPFEGSEELPPLAFSSELDPTEDEIQATIIEYQEMELPVVDIEEPPAPPLLAHYEKWLAVQQQYPQALVLIIVNNDMEVYDKHAKQLSDLFMLKLDSRDFGPYGCMPKVRFPYTDFERYFDQLNTRYEMALITTLDCGAVHYPKEAAKQWLTETAYADEDGVVHETNPAIDTAAFLKLQRLIGDILIVR
jgi:hypothetical protein